VELVSDRRYPFPVPPVALWSALAATGDYQAWWPWLRSFDAIGLHAGDRWHCTVRPPLPYTLRFVIHLDDVDEPRSVVSHLTGDIRGPARIDIVAVPTGSEIHLTSSLTPSTRAFGLVAALARPIARRGHDWVLDTGARQFVSRALAGRDEVSGT